MSDNKGSYKELRERFDTYKQNCEALNTQQYKQNQTLINLDKKVREHKVRLDELEVELANSRNEVVRLQPQLVSTVGVRDRAFGYGYGARLAHLKTYLLAHPCIDLKRLILDEFKPAAADIQFIDSWGHGTCLMLL